MSELIESRTIATKILAGNARMNVEEIKTDAGILLVSSICNNVGVGVHSVFIPALPVATTTIKKKVKED